MNYKKEEKPTLKLKKAFGMIKTKKSFSEKDYQEAIAEAVVKKFRRRPRQS